MTKAEAAFIERRAGAYALARQAALRAICDCPQLVGAKKIREPMAHTAALKALGFATKPFEPPKSAGVLDVRVLELMRKVFADAVEAARATKSPGENQ